ncbi:MAG: glycosyltransferase [Cyanobium sp.]
MASELFIGITSWNSQMFLPTCLQAIRATTAHLRVRVCVVDNVSSAASARIAREHGAEVISRSCTQPEALNLLLRRSREPHTLMLHADVVLLHPHWYELCQARLSPEVALVSPEDIGCGPLTRPFGVGKHESSFLFFRTEALRRCRRLVWHRHRRIPLPRREFNFSGGHVTHNMPALLEREGLGWFPMKMHVSNREETPLYVPAEPPLIWSEELGYLRYGLGNFYGIDDELTHYHNWYDRVGSRKPQPEGSSKLRREFPGAFIRQYSDRFQADHQADRVDLHRDLHAVRVPQAL